MVKSDGTQFWARLEATAARDEGGAPVLRVVLSDITDRKRAEAALQEKVEELRQALDQIKTLSGILPICMHCKKIRDDKGSWNRMEIYIRDRTEAEFSHGICPECMKKLYPEVRGMRRPSEGGGPEP
jgi:PAS domain-containing protein